MAHWVKRANIEEESISNWVHLPIIMTTYKHLDTGEEIRGKELFGHVKADSWSLEGLEGGGFQVTTAEGETFEVKPTE